MKKYIFIFILFLFPTFYSFAESIDVKLISYEDKKDIFDETPTCEMEFTVTNNSWGTMYGLKITSESYDDRGDKLENYAFNGSINAFGGLFSDTDAILLGNSSTSKSLHLKSKCQYIAEIFMTKVKPSNCNIRMMPEDGNCLTIINPFSDIDHIKLIKK